MKLARLMVPVALGGITLFVIAFAGKLIYNQFQVQELTLATASRQGDYYTFGQALATVIHRHYPHLRIRVLETKGSRDNIEQLSKGQVHLAIAQSDTPGDASVRTIASLFPEVFHLLVQRNSDIQSIPDLRGKRVALMTKGSGSYTFFWELLQHYDLKSADLQATPLSPDAASEQFKQGQFDALFRSIALGSDSMRSLIQATNASLVPFDQVSALQLGAKTAYVEPIQIPRGTYRGNPATPPQHLPVAGVQAMLLSHESVSKALVYDITASLYEHRNELAALTPRATTITVPKPRGGLGLPLHPGANDYYNQDQPGFLEQYAEAMGFLLSAGILLLSAIWNLRNRLQKRQKNLGDRYNLQVLELAAHVNTLEDRAQIQALQLELFEIFQTVLDDFDHDRISAETFQAFAVTWQVVIASLRHREVILHNGAGAGT
jgi:TRAP transporter TAXI family solute receptor